MKACIFESKIIEEYGEIHFLEDSICIFNDECIIQYPYETKINQEFSVNFAIFEKIFGKLSDDATFSPSEKGDKHLLIKSENAIIKLALKSHNLKSVKERLRDIPGTVPKQKLKNPYHYSLFHALELCATAIVPFGSLSQPFNSYLYYNNGEMFGCSSFKAARIALKIKDTKVNPFIISGDSAMVLVKIGESLYKEDTAGSPFILFEINEDYLYFKFHGVVVTIANGYGTIEYPIEKIQKIFSIKGKKIRYPNKRTLSDIIGRISLFPCEFEDTTERIYQSFSKRGIKFFSKNAAGSIEEKYQKRQIIKDGSFSFQYADFKTVLDKLITDDKEKVSVRLFDGEKSVFIFSDKKCKYLISATKEIVK